MKVTAEEPICVLRVTTVTPLFLPSAGLVHALSEADRQKATGPKVNQFFQKCKYNTHWEYVHSTLQGP